MKAIALTLKKEIFKFDIPMYLTWLCGLICGCFAYLNTPAFIIDMIGIFSSLKKIAELAWGMFSAALMTIIVVFATKFAGQIWEDRLKPFYYRKFKKKKIKKQDGETD